MSGLVAPPPQAAMAGLVAPSLQAHSHVAIFSRSANRWFEDGVVLEASPAGVRVRFNKDAAEKLVPPELVATMLKPAGNAPAPQSAAPGAPLAAPPALPPAAPAAVPPPKGGPPQFPPGAPGRVGAIAQPPVQGGVPANRQFPWQAQGNEVVARQPEGYPLAIRTEGRHCNVISHQVPNGTRLRVHFDPGPKDDMIQIVGFSGELPGWVKRKNVRLGEAYAANDKVAIFSRSQQRWFCDGVVREITPAGVKVLYNGLVCEKVVLNDQVGALLAPLANGLLPGPPEAAGDGAVLPVCPMLPVGPPQQLGPAAHGAGAATPRAAPTPVAAVSPKKRERVQVLLNIYDLGDRRVVRGMNRALRLFGAGAYHAGVEVHGAEWSYGAGFQLTYLDGSVVTDPDDIAASGFGDPSSGIFACDPRGCEVHKYRESIFMGETDLDAAEVEALLDSMREEWTANGYDLTRHNCCSFSEAFCEELGVGSLPAWVARLARTAAPLSNIKDEGKRARGATVDENYKFGDMTRGVVHILGERVRSMTHGGG